MSYGLRDGFWPTSLPLFHAPRFSMTSMTASLVVDRGLIFGRRSERLLSLRYL